VTQHERSRNLDQDRVVKSCKRRVTSMSLPSTGPSSKRRETRSNEALRLREHVRQTGMRRAAATLTAIAALGAGAPAAAQRTGENPVTAADDAFGTSVGNETIGLYSIDEVRGFSPASAGNIRIDGLYLGGIVIGNQRIQSGSTVRVGLSAQGYPFPAPTGIVELSLRPAGKDPTLSGVLYAGQSQIGVDLDAQLPVGKQFSIAAGISFNHLIDFPGGDYANYLAIGIAPVWRPREGTEVRSFYGVELGPTDRSTPFTFVDGSELPPELPNHFLGQKWAAWKNRFDTAGLFGHYTFGDWRLSAGLFHQVIDSKRSHNTLFVGARGDGSANYVVNIHPPRKTTSDAAEVRLSRQFNEGPRHHVVHLSVKGRMRIGDFGGENVVDFGPVMIGEVPPDFPEPTDAFGEETRD
jgi:iron complex outermembrane receptor protein